MYAFTIPAEHAGKTLSELIISLQETEEFKKKLCTFHEAQAIVSLDSDIIISTAFPSTPVRAGQVLKIFPLLSGG